MVYACSPTNSPLGLSYGVVLWMDHPTGKTLLKGFQSGNTKEEVMGSDGTVCLLAGALPKQLARCARRVFANFICDLCVATTAYDRFHESPLSCDSPHDNPADISPVRGQTLSCALSSCPVRRKLPCLVPCLAALSYDSSLPRCLSCPCVITCCPTSGLSGCSSGHGRDHPCCCLSSSFRSFRRQQGCGAR